MTTDSTANASGVNPWSDAKFVATYERWAVPESSKLARIALERAEVVPGARLLDVGAGTGSLAVQAAQQGYSVLAFDSSPLMVEKARRLLTDYPDSSVVRMDMQAFELPDNSFDAAFAILSATITPHREAALQEMVRVVRPGGTLCVVHWASPQGWPAFGIMLNALRKLESPSAAASAAPDVVPFEADELAAVGCVDVSVERLEVPATLPAPATFLDDLDGFFSIMFPGYAELTPDDRAAVQMSITQDIEQETANHGSLMMQSDIGIGRIAAP